MSGELEIRGGIGGIAARLEDLDRVAGLLRSVATQLFALGRRLARIQTTLEIRPGWVLSGGLSAGTFAAAQLAMVVALSGPAGLLVAGGRARALGVALEVAVAAYRQADTAVATGFHGTELAIGRLIGSAVVGDPALVAGAALLGGLAFAAGGRIDQGFRLERLDQFGADVVRELSGHAGLVQVAAGVLPGVAGQRDVRGLASVVAGAGGWLGRIEAGGGPGGAVWLRDSADVEVRPRPVPWAGPPAGVGGLVGRIPSSRGPDPLVHVERLEGADGRRRWLVALPGTADWSPAPGRTPFDLTGDVALMAGRATAGRAGVVAAMRAVGVRPGEPVLVEGHSQGGILAATLAADPKVRAEFDVSRVVTTGAPIAWVPVPAAVPVLSIEHRDDLVPQLDGRANPATPAWVTVTAPDPGGTGRPTGTAASPLPAHALERYRETANLLDRSPHPSLTEWRAGLAGFTGPPGAPAAAGAPATGVVRGAAWDVEISRVGRW
jgi:hypothetical protein